MTLWLIPQDASQKPRPLVDHAFTPRFYVHGPEPRLQRLARALEARARVSCALREKTNIWDGKALRVLEVSVRHPTQFSALVRFVHRCDGDLLLFNSDLMLAPLYCWEKGVFPLAKIEVEVGEDSALTCRHDDEEVAATNVRTITCHDDPWALDYELPPLRVMRLRLEGLARVDPQHGRRGALEIEIDGEPRQVLDDSEEPVVMGVKRLLDRHDPDLIVSEWGDATLLPALLRQARKYGVELGLNRDPVRRAVERSRARSYTSYGRVLFKDSATTLRGRLHVDTQNSFIADQCELAGLWELARVTKLPVQYAARTTTGTGISYMQMELAYHDGVLIPEQKAEPESPKHPDELLLADRGGLIFPPRLGFFTNVGELDFISEYPSIMARFNISPETVNCPCCPQGPRIPELGYRICQRRRGITSRVVERLIWKREEYKKLMATAGAPLTRSARLCSPPGRGAEGEGNTVAAVDDRQEDGTLAERRSSYKLRRSALKWLLVCCFGYTGYKNARFGKIEAHESINAMAREKLLVAKETAEQQGFSVLYALVDSLYVQKAEATRHDYERLARAIEQRTGLPMALENVYRYVVFLPSKQHAEVPVPNRFFCVSEEGELKIRGLECRKHDTAPLVARMQQEALRILAEAHDFSSYCQKLEEARKVLQRYLDRLENGTVPAEELVISRRLTRPPGQYQKNSVTAIAAQQLDRAGVRLRPGESIDYILTDTDSPLPDERVRAFTLWEGWCGYDMAKYKEALRQAFEPLEHYLHPAATRSLENSHSFSRLLR